jgi:hypothetical protein
VTLARCPPAGRCPLVSGIRWIVHGGSHARFTSTSSTPGATDDLDAVDRDEPDDVVGEARECELGVEVAVRTLDEPSTGSDVKAPRPR